MKRIFFLFLILFSSCEVRKNKHINESIYVLPEPEPLYQKIEVFQIKNEEVRTFTRYKNTRDYNGKKKKKREYEYQSIYVVGVCNSNNDTSYVYLNYYLGPGLYWAQTVQRENKIIEIVFAEEYETVKLN